MSLFRIAVAMTIAATSATAEQDFDYDILLDADLDVENNDIEVLRCRDKATGPEWRCWFRSNKYQAQDRYEKLDQITSKINESLTEEPVDAMWTEIGNFFTQKSNGAFCQSADEEIRKNRKKSTHTQGLVAPVEWVPYENNLNYTAIYKTGSDSVIMRISEAGNLYENGKGLTPSMGLKFLVDNAQSENILVQQGFTPSGSWNFFDADLTNRLPQGFDTTTVDGYIMDQTFRKKITEANSRPFGLAISHIGQTQNNGMKLDKQDVKVPYQLHFKAPQKLREAIDVELELSNSADKLKWYEAIKDLMIEGDTIYEVFAQTDPIFPEDQAAGITAEDKMVKIADITLKSQLMTSQWADEKLYFRHRPIGKDRRFWDKKGREFDEDVKFDKKDPENLFGRETPDWPEETEAGRDLYIEQVEKWGCPFEWLMPEGWKMPS